MARLRSDLHKKLLWASFAAICTYLSFKLLHYHYSLITFPWPVEFRETAMLLSTEMLMKGGNPYLFENQPIYTNQYGLLYNLMVWPLATFFGASLTVHKAVAGFFTLSICAGVFAYLKRESVPYLPAWGGVLIVYETLLFNKTSLAEPDSLGVLLYLLSIVITVLCRYSSRSLAFSIIAGLAAFYTKPYYVVGVPCVGLYLFLFVSRKKGIAYLLNFLIFLALSVVIMDKLFESYFYNTFLAHLNFADNNTNWMINQWKEFVLFYPGIIAAVIILAAIRLFCRANEPREYTSTALGLRQLCGKEFSLPLFTALCVSLLFTVKLGKHTGAYMTYLYQLVSPLLVLAIFPWLFKQRKTDFIVIPLVALNLFMSSWNYKDIYSDFRAHDNGDWQKAFDYVSSHRNILNSPAVAPLLFAQGRKVYDSGHSEYFACSILKPPPFPLFSKIDRVSEQSKRFFMEVDRNISGRYFDLLMLDRSYSGWLIPEELVASNYVRRDVLTLYMPHTGFTWVVDVWEPLK